MTFLYNQIHDNNNIIVVYVARKHNSVAISMVKHSVMNPVGQLRYPHQENDWPLEPLKTTVLGLMPAIPEFTSGPGWHGHNSVMI